MKEGQEVTGAGEFTNSCGWPWGSSMWGTQTINGQRAAGSCDWWPAGAATPVVFQEIARGGKTKGGKFELTALL